ncbi:MAG: HTH domain-containing protein [Bacillota bacterium]
MSQQSIVIFLKKDKDKFFSAKEIAQQTNLNIQTTINALSKMEKYGEVVIQEVQSNGVTGKTKFYKINLNDEIFENVLHEINGLQREERFSFTSPDAIRQMMLITEIRKLREELKNAKK